MFMDEMRRAIAAAPLASLHAVACQVWKAHAGGAIDDASAQGLAEAIEARKKAGTLARRVSRAGARPRSGASMERRRRWAASGRMPPAISARFTLAEAAVLSVVATEVSERGDCRLSIGHIAALAGVCATTVRNAIREATRLCLISVEERRLSAWRNAPNVVRILAAEWRAWLRLRSRYGVDAKRRTPRIPNKSTLDVPETGVGRARGLPRGRAGPTAPGPSVAPRYAEGDGAMATQR